MLNCPAHLNSRVYRYYSHHDIVHHDEAAGKLLWTGPCGIYSTKFQLSADRCKLVFHIGLFSTETRVIMAGGDALGDAVAAECSVEPP